MRLRLISGRDNLIPLSSLAVQIPWTYQRPNGMLFARELARNEWQKDSTSIVAKLATFELTALHEPPLMLVAV